MQKESDLQHLTNLRDNKGEESRKDYSVCTLPPHSPVHFRLILHQVRLQAEGFDDEDALVATIKKLETDLKKARKKETDGDEPMVCLISHRLVIVFVNILIDSFPARKNHHSRYWTSQMLT